MSPRWSRTAGIALFFVAGSCSQGPGDAEAESSSPLCLSEIMYHPVLEDDFDERHEFVELHNPTGKRLSLAGYRLTGGIRYGFAADAAIEPSSYVVVAKDRAALLGVAEYALDLARVVGDYEGELSNAGETITLEAPDGIVERVTYSDAPPWPVAADGFGAQDDFLRPELLPLEGHRYRGVSLERVSCASPADAPSSWAPSDVDAATPGRVSPLVREVPFPIVTSLTTTPSPAVRSSDPVTVNAAFSAEGELASVTLEYFIDDPEQEDETATALPMSAGDGGRSYSARIPPQPAGVVVRYRVLADSELGSQPISPRPSDPYAWHAYAVDAEIPSSSRVYQLFIASDRWTELWDNLEAGRVQGCTVSASWDAEVPGVFVHDGQVFDVRLRYQGSQYNRASGREISSWSAAGPARPSPLLAMSWHIKFPRYARFEGQRAIGLNKLTQGCPGITAGVGFELFRRAGVPAPATRFARVHVNGSYYHYMQQIALVDEVLLEAYHAAQGADPVEPLGHLFKASGTFEEEGPYGPGDGRVLGANCGFSSLERYGFVYERKTHDWLGAAEIMALIDGLHAARAQGDAALRTFLGANFDVPLTLSYLAVMNWLSPWDDMFQNHFLYQRRSDGRWFLLPWDLDLTAGGWEGTGPNTSLFVGQEDDPDNRDGLWNYFKDSFLRTYRAEYLARLRELDASVLAPTAVRALVAEVVASMDEPEALDAPAGMDCDLDNRADEYRTFADERHQTVLAAE